MYPFRRFGVLIFLRLKSVLVVAVPLAILAGRPFLVRTFITPMTAAWFHFFPSRKANEIVGI